MEVLELREQDKKKWDEYVWSSSQATVFQLAGWKDVMENTFGLKSHFLFAREGDQILGVLPLLYIKSRLSGHFLTSMPGGLCAQDDQASTALIEWAKALTTADRAKYLILRDGRHKWNLPELVTNEDHCTFVVKLSPEPERVWQRLKGKARQLTNKGRKAGVEVVTGPNFLDHFYPIYSQAMRDKGTPTLGLDFFRNMIAQFTENFTLQMVRLDQQVLGGGFIACFKDTVYCTWAGMLHQFYHLHPSYLLYWETLKYGCENGFKWVDLGRSRRDSGSSIFKMKWGAAPQPLYQQYYLNGIAQPPPVGSSVEENARYRFLINVWRRLPLSVAEVLGPQLRKRMPFG